MELLRRICDLPQWSLSDSATAVIQQFWAGLIPPQTFKVLLLSEGVKWVPVGECIIQQW